MKRLNPHFALQNGNGFNPDVELLRVYTLLSKKEKFFANPKQCCMGLAPIDGYKLQNTGWKSLIMFEAGSCFSHSAI